MELSKHKPHALFFILFLLNAGGWNEALNCFEITNCHNVIIILKKYCMLMYRYNKYVHAWFQIWMSWVISELL